MTARGRIQSIFGVAGACLCLAGCGIVSSAAQQVTAAVAQPISDTAGAIGKSVNLVSNTLSSSSTALSQSALAARQTATIASQNVSAVGQSTLSTASAVPTSLARISSAGSSAQAGKGEDTKAIPTLDVLPPEVLKKLTKEQAGLQHAAQTAAFTAQVGETIFWDRGGRKGTAVTESEDHVGSFICRTFQQTVTIDDKVEQGHGQACHAADGAWTASF